LSISRRGSLFPPAWVKLDTLAPINTPGAATVASIVQGPGIGSVATIFTGMPVWRSSGGQLLLGLAAAGVTFGIGRLVGIGIVLGLRQPVPHRLRCLRWSGSALTHRARSAW
jgi:hypothetical protein